MFVPCHATTQGSPLAEKLFIIYYLTYLIIMSCASFSNKNHKAFMILVHVPLYRFPTFMKPYLVCLHSSPITCSNHIHDCPQSLFDQIETAGRKQLETDFSNEVSCVAWKHFSLNTGPNGSLELYLLSVFFFLAELAHYRRKNFD